MGTRKKKLSPEKAAAISRLDCVESHLNLIKKRASRRPSPLVDDLKSILEMTSSLRKEINSIPASSVRWEKIVLSIAGLIAVAEKLYSLISFFLILCNENWKDNSLASRCRRMEPIGVGKAA
jgi:hypothetical protein